MKKQHSLIQQSLITSVPSIPSCGTGEGRGEVLPRVSVVSAVESWALGPVPDDQLGSDAAPDSVGMNTLTSVDWTQFLQPANGALRVAEAIKAWELKHKGSQLLFVIRKGLIREHTYLSGAQVVLTKLIKRILMSCL